MFKIESERPLRRWLLAAAAVAVLTAGLTPLMLAEQVRAQGDGPETKAWKNITMIYTTDIKGKIDPCG